MAKDKKYMSPREKDYFDKVHRWGIMWTIGAILMLLSIPVLICVKLGVLPDGEALKQVLPQLMTLYWLTAIAEVIAYVPMLGAGGTYLSFVTGNISNLKLPVGLNAMNSAKVKANTEEGEVIATIAIGVSAIVTTIIIAVGVVVFSLFVGPEVLQAPSIKPAFDFVLPALFGALAASYFEKYWKLVIVAVLVGVIVLIFSPSMGVGTLMFITIVATLAAGFGMYKLKWI
ncbi:MAG: hypothetical protein IJ279_00680 [Clostridia bacterium]|nr:hypothetical protein [Clostridia bacterium]